MRRRMTGSRAASASAIRGRDSLAKYARRRRDFDKLERRRLQAAKLLKQGLSQAEIARQLKVSRESVRRWANQIATGGSIRALEQAGRAGRKPKLGPPELRKLGRILRAGPAKSGFRDGPWTLKRIASVIRRQFKVQYHPRYVWWILNKKLNWNPLER